MDAYETKLKELRVYVPFLTKMIDKLEKAGDKSKEAQLAKMRSLKGILTAPDKKLRLDTLAKCEDVLHKLYEKVEGVPLISPSSPEESSRSPQKEQGSLSSYLQQIHETQFQDPGGQRGRFGGGRGGMPIRGGARPSPWMNNKGNQSWQQQQQQPNNESWNSRDRGPQQFNNGPPFRDRPDPWGNNRGGRQNFDQQQNSGFRAQQRFHDGAPPFGVQQRHPQQQQGNGPPFRDEFHGQFNDQRRQFNDNRGEFRNNDRGQGGGHFGNNRMHQDQQFNDERGAAPFREEQRGPPFRSEDNRFREDNHRVPPFREEIRPGPQFREDINLGPSFREENNHGRPPFREENRGQQFREEARGHPFRDDDRNVPIREDVRRPPFRDDVRGGSAPGKPPAFRDDRGPPPFREGSPFQGGSNSRFQQQQQQHQHQHQQQQQQQQQRGPFAMDLQRSRHSPQFDEQEPPPLSSKKDFVKEWNRGVRGPVSDSPRSPGPVTEVDDDDLVILDTPKSPDQLETPKSPVNDTIETPQSPAVDTPMSPDGSTPMSPTNDTPASPTNNDENNSKQLQGSSAKPDPKVIPLERDPRQFLRKTSESPSSGDKFDIRSPKDWHRGLRGPTTSSSPRSEASDDSEKSQKRLQIVESPASSSPASPASGESANKPPPVLPTPIPITGPTTTTTPTTTPTATPTATTTTTTTTTTSGPKLPQPKSLHQFQQQSLMHPSRPPRPPLLEPPTNNPSTWRHNHMSQPRLPHPSNNDQRPPPHQNPPQQHFGPRGPHPQQHQHPRGPPPPIRPEVKKRALTYGEYRKLREEAEKRHYRPQQPQIQQEPPKQPLMSRRDPRRPPKSSEPPIKSEPSSTSSIDDKSGPGLTKFKIPKKKRTEDTPEVISSKRLENDDKVKKRDDTKVKEEIPERTVDEVVESSNNESDSEPELKIAESSDNEDEVSVPKEAETIEEEEQPSEEGKGQLTKAILQTLVASIDTKDASKLLARATRLLNNSEEGHKLSLKQLLVGDSDSEDDTTPVKATEAAKVVGVQKGKKGRPPKAVKSPKAVKAPTPGTRRSRRLQTPDEPEVTEEASKQGPVINDKPADMEVDDKVADDDNNDEDDDDDDDDDDDNQLVIDEASFDQEDINTDHDDSFSSTGKRSRGRPRGRPKTKSENKAATEEATPEDEPTAKVDVSGYYCSKVLKSFSSFFNICFL
jgi:hypothetical protein